MKPRVIFFILLMLFSVTPLFAQNASYRVAFVTSDDVLNMRAGAGVSNRIVGSLPFDAVDILITGAGQRVGRSTWVPIQYGTLTGWVNRYFLTEDVSSTAFCDDAAPLQLIETFRIAIAEQDGAQLRTLVHPIRGLLIHHGWYNPEVRLSAAEVGSFFTGATVHNWGYASGSGFAIEGTPAQIILPLLQIDLLAGDIAGCNEVVGSATTIELQLPAEYQALNHYSVYRPAPSDADAFNWGTWVVGVEYWDGQPYIAYLVHYKWEI